MDKETSIQEIKDKIRNYCEDRDWDQFHNPKDLAIGIITEASELLEQFRFKSEQDIKNLLHDPTRKEALEDEMADVFYFLLRLAQKYEIDMSTAFIRKMGKNETNYPIEKARGSNKKYNEF